MPNNNTEEPKLITVIGASAGGLNSIVELCTQFNEKTDTAVFVVLHLSRVADLSVVISRMQRNTAFVCTEAKHGAVIQKGHLYLAVPDQHLVLQQGVMLLGRGPHENRWRPSIDILFRSAAAAYDGRVVGIILTGLMQDGVAGMLAVQRCGGTTIVQEPDEAEYPDLPHAVLENMKPDYCLQLGKMGAVLEEKSKNGNYTGHDIPYDVQKEASIAARVALGLEEVEPLGERSNYVCPDCGGALFEMAEDALTRYRCYTGHVYNQKELLMLQNEKLEGTLWIALRMMEERKNLLDKMAAEEISKGWKHSGQQKKERADDLQTHIQRLKEILFATKEQARLQ